jgi:negative regulator of flagellin synthesis FlgM
MPVDGINDNGKLGPVALTVVKSRQDNGNSSKTAAAREHDSVQISDWTQEFLRIRRLVDDFPDVRLERVNQLARAIDEGTYNVKGEQIAQAIIQKHQIDLEG